MAVTRTPTVGGVDILETVGAAGQVASVAFAVPAVFVAYFAYWTSKHSAEATAKLTEVEQGVVPGA